MLFEKIRSLCELEGISFAKLEKKLNLANGSVCKWKKTVPGIDKAIKLADYFNISLDELIGRSNYTISNDARKLALKYETLSSEKQNLVQCYISVIDSERRTV